MALVTAFVKGSSFAVAARQISGAEMKRTTERLDGIPVSSLWQPSGRNFSQSEESRLRQRARGHKNASVTVQFAQVSQLSAKWLPATTKFSVHVAMMATLAGGVPEDHQQPPT